VVFIETPIFVRTAARVFDDDDLAALQTALMLRPAAGVVVPGSGGLRKLRFAARGHGKRSGARVIYYWVQTDDQIFLLYAYAKNETSDITAAQARQLRQLAEE
jgi:hypothetical protein